LAEDGLQYLAFDLQVGLQERPDREEVDIVSRIVRDGEASVRKEERDDMENDFVWEMRLVLNLEIVTDRLFLRGKVLREVVLVCAFELILLFGLHVSASAGGSHC
jgi:hypothetical protein